jgi:ABC-type lipoprotein export system ATPase subunit
MGASGAGKSTLLNTLLFRNLGNLKVTNDGWFSILRYVTVILVTSR